jgi:purine-binding chemotaxis protein CheW
MPAKIADTTRNAIAKVAKQASIEEEKIVPMEQLVTFELDQEEYASAIADLREIIVIPDIISIPNAPNFIRGILNLRGQIVLVLDLEKRFHLDREHQTESRHVIIIEAEGNWYGVMVDEVTGVIRVPVSSIKPSPSLVSSKISDEYVRGVVVVDQEESSLEHKAHTKKSSVEAGAQEEDDKKVMNEASEKTNQKINIQENKEKDSEGNRSIVHSRLILLIDFPRLLKEKELLEIGETIKQTAEEVQSD